MQHFNQTESTINYQNQSFENAVSFGVELNQSDDSLAILDSASYQSDSNSAFFNGPNSGDYNMQTNFMFNDKYSSNNSYLNQFDEISQTSTCSSQFDDSMNSRKSMFKNQNSAQKQPQQTTPLKSVPEEDSSPQSIQSQTPNKSTFGSSSVNSKFRKNENIMKLYEMTDEPERKLFLDKLFSFNENIGKTIITCPRIAKNLIDLYKIYNMVKERGGFVEVSKNQKWRDIAESAGFPYTTTVAYSLRKQYIKHLLEFECHFDLNGAKSEVLIEQTDIKNKRKKPKAPQSLSPTINQQPSQISVQLENQLTTFIPSPAPKQSPLSNTFSPQQQFQQQTVYKHSSPNQVTNNANTITKLQPQQQIHSNQGIWYGGFDSAAQQQKNEQMMNHDQQYTNQNDQITIYDQQYTNQNDQITIYDQHGFPINQPDYNNNMSHYYNQYESENSIHYQSPTTTGNQAIMQKKNSAVSSTQSQQPQHYYSDSINSSLPPPSQQAYNSNQYNYNEQQIQYSGYNNYQSSHSENLYTDPAPPRMPTSQRTVPAMNEQPQYSSKVSYQFTNNNYDYASLVSVQQQQVPSSTLPQMNRAIATSQQSNYSPFPRIISQPQQTTQQYMMESNIGNLPADAKQQYNQIENWQMNSNSMNNWNTLNSYSAPQQFAIESPIQQKQQLQFSPVNSTIYKSSSQQHQIPPNAFYPSNHSSMPKFMTPPPQHIQPNHYSNSLNPTIFNQQQIQIQQQYQTPFKMPIKREYPDFPPDCIESVKPKGPLNKRKLLAKDLTSVDPSKWIMSLKSGLLGESTQALNGFTIVSSDNSTHNQIKLFKHPGLLPLLMQYFKYFLSELFPDVFPSLIETENPTKTASYASKSESTIEPNFNKYQNSMTLEALIGQIDPQLKFDSNEFILTSLYPKKKIVADQKPTDSTAEDQSKPKKINHFDECENEAKIIEEDTFLTISKFKEDNNHKCINISTVIRNLSLINGNEQELANDRDLLHIIENFGELTNQYEKKSKENENKENWWIEALSIIQENAFVTLAQMSACLNFQDFDEEISLPILSGLLHWAICPSATATDNFKYTSIRSCSPKRIALECLAKLSICESNVDLLIATPPLNRSYYDESFSTLTQLLSKSEEQIIREFALVLLHNFVMCDQGVAIAICSSTNIVAELINYLLQYEENQISREPNQLVDHQHNLTHDMARRAAACLNNLASIKENHAQFAKQETKLSQLLFSNVLEESLGKQMSEIAYKLNPHDGQSNDQLELATLR